MNAPEVVRADSVAPGDTVLTYGREVREVRAYEGGRSVEIVFTGSDRARARVLARRTLRVCRGVTT